MLVLYNRKESTCLNAHLISGNSILANVRIDQQAQFPELIRDGVFHDFTSDKSLDNLQVKPL